MSMHEEMERSRVTGPVMTRRRFLKSGVRWGAGLFAFMALGVSYPTGMEPRWLEVVRTRLTLPHLPEAFRGIRIVHFSDVHYGYHFGLGRLERLVERIAEEKADMICFTGDLVDVTVGEDGLEIARILQRLEAPLGKYAVLGNHDYFRNPQKVADTLTVGGFRTLRNESIPVEKAGQRIRLIGSDEGPRKRQEMEAAYRTAAPGECSILLTHTPDSASKVLEYEIGLQLSGHSHGGQVRLPFFGKLARVPGALLYPDGLVELERPKGGSMQLYTNRGIGMTGLPVRFGCRPELTVHTLV